MRESSDSYFHDMVIATIPADGGASEVSRFSHRPADPRGCHFMSFGISTDYSFDAQLGKPPYSCKGYAFDPTSDHPTNLTDNVIFLKTGAHSPIMEKSWHTVSVPDFRKFLDRDLFALKMDCEGCEYSLAYDVIQHDRHFLQHITQLNIELHLPLVFMGTENDVYSLGRLYRMLKLSHFSLVHADKGRCHPNDEKSGCHPLLVKTGFDCLPGCQSFLFAKLNLQGSNSSSHHSFKPLD